MTAASTSPARICLGIDLDNTIINYENLFSRVAIDLGLLPESMRRASKADVKRALSQDNDGHDWMRLQGQVYGQYVSQAKPYTGALETLRSLTANPDLRVCIVSHKTRYGHFDETRADLRDAAMDWLAAHELVGSNSAGVDERDIFFTDSREEKIGVVGNLGCRAVVDDLIEVLTHSAFPATSRRILFAPNSRISPTDDILVCRSWLAVENALRECVAGSVL